MYTNLAILALFVFLYSAVAGRIERSTFTGPIVFTAFGFALGPAGLGVLTLDVDTELLRTLAELTLALVLYTDAANADLKVLRSSLRIPQRLLLIGLPLTILLGFAAGAFIFDGLSLLEIAILATMLAPTDAALGLAVISNPSVPSNIREGLNVESGLNDGICVPILFVFLELVLGSRTEGSTAGLVLEVVAREIGIGLAVGLGLTILGGLVLWFCTKKGWITETWSQLPVVGLSVACFAVAQSLGGSGFIAAFAGGLLFGALARQHKQELLLAAEGTGGTLALITWVAFGAGVIGKVIGYVNWSSLLYAVLSLTLIRMLPVYLSLAGTGLKAGAKLFLGWFGPRGLASVVFGIIVLDADLPGSGLLAVVVVCTVVLSILAHGLTANPLAKTFGK